MSGGSVAYKTLDYQSRDLSPASPVFRMRLQTEVPSVHGLIVGGTFNPSSLTHSLIHLVKVLIFGTPKIIVI